MCRTKWPWPALCSGGILTALVACGGPGPSSRREAEVTHAASNAADVTPLAEVGYDLRLLRPTDEPLGARFERLRAAAQAEGKHVAVLFSADWCEPCQLLELELGNMHPVSAIGSVRIFQLKEEDWEAATRMDEVHALRQVWHPTNYSYPVLVLLDADGGKREEMKEARARLEAAGITPTLPRWFEALGPVDAS